MDDKKCVSDEEPDVVVNGTLAILWTVGSVILICLWISVIFGGCAYKGNINIGTGRPVQMAKAETSLDDAVKDLGLLKDFDRLADRIQLGPEELPDFDLGSGGGVNIPGESAPLSNRTPSGSPPPDPVDVGDMPPPPPPDPEDRGGLDDSFKWKAAGEHTDKLVVITPYWMTGDRLTAGGSEGRLSGRANGNRQHWRFDKHGSAFGNNVEVIIWWKSSVIGRWVVPHGGQNKVFKSPKPAIIRPETPKPDPPPVDDLTALERESRLWVRENMLHIDPALDVRYKVDRNPGRGPGQGPNTTIRASGGPLTKVPYDSAEMFYQIIDRKGPPHSMTLWGYF